MNRLAASLTAVGVIAWGAVQPAAAQDTILNASYDVAREVFVALNPVFAEKWQADTGRTVDIQQSHAGTSKQARSILEGLEADIVTFNQVTDIAVLVEGGLVAPDWATRLPDGASPWYSLPAFLVRSGNPKGIHDWGDLVGDGVQVIFPNPKTSGNARYTYLGAFAWALEANGGDQQAALDFVASLFSHVPVFDTGGRAATTTFVERGIGDVLITFESEVNAITREYPDGGYEIVVPPTSILAEFPVSVVDSVVDKRGTRDLATAYLQFLYSPEAQEILAQFSNRVRDPGVAARHAAEFPEVKLVTVEDVFGGWDKVSEEHFAEGGLLDQVFVNP
jgi:sulfate transport system substrate-binding protein